MDMAEKIPAHAIVVADVSSSMRCWGKHHILSNACRSLLRLPSLFPGQFASASFLIFAWNDAILPCGESRRADPVPADVLGKSNSPIWKLPPPRGKADAGKLLRFLLEQSGDGCRAFLLLTDCLFGEDEARSLRRGLAGSGISLSIIPVGADADWEEAKKLASAGVFAPEDIILAAETLAGGILGTKGLPRSREEAEAALALQEKLCDQMKSCAGQDVRNVNGEEGGEDEEFWD